jgi:branched-chain amino acid transport system ATP-binding protein
MNLLVLDKLTRFFGGISAANNVDLSLAAGELHCLIGPNGAGKSTVFKLIMGLLAPQSGQVFFRDSAVTRLPPFQRVRLGLGMTYQSTRIFANLTVAQNIKVARHRGLGDGGDMAWALENLGLTRRLPDPATALSYGEQHWLEMCMALGGGPKVMLMDEPTAGMTPEETHRTADFVKDLNARGMTIMVIEHDMGFVREIARQVTVLHQGRIFRQGTLAEIESDPDVQRIYLGESHD